MSRIWRTIRSYIWWTHERGSFHYDVMVTLILAFIFLAPLRIHFNDEPAKRNPHTSEVVVHPLDGTNFVYEIDAAAVTGTDDRQIREELKGLVESIAGEIFLDRYEAVRDEKGRVKSYRAWVRR